MRDHGFKQLPIALKRRLQYKFRLLRTVPVRKLPLVLKLGLFASFVPLIMRLPLSRSSRFLTPANAPTALHDASMALDRLQAAQTSTAPDRLQAAEASTAPDGLQAANSTAAHRSTVQMLSTQQPYADYIQYTDIALRLGRPITQNRCLTRCVTLYYFLSRKGLNLAIVFGAGSLNGQFAAHCWLEWNGLPFAEQENPYTVYKPTYSIPDTALENTIANNG